MSRNAEMRAIALEQLKALGWSVDDLLSELHEHDTARDCIIYLTGSIGEGLANKASDVDILLIHETDADAEPWPSEQVVLMQENSAFNRLAPSGNGRAGCQVEHASVPRIARLTAAMARMLDPDDKHIALLGYADRRLLHRIKIGLPLQRISEAEALQRRVTLSAFDEYCLLSNLKEADSFIVDARAAMDAGRLATAARMIQISASLTASAMLCAIGSTNNNPKWSIELLERERDSFPEDRVQAALDCIFIDRRATEDEAVCRRAFASLTDLFVGLVTSDPERLDPRRYRFYTLVSDLN